MNIPAGLFARFLTVLCLCCAWGLAGGTEGGSYEAPLPVPLSTDPDLCAYVPCKDVMPGADSFSHRMGKPAYVEAYRNKKEGHGEQKGRTEKDSQSNDKNNDNDNDKKGGQGKQKGH